MLIVLVGISLVSFNMLGCDDDDDDDETTLFVRNYTNETLVEGYVRLTGTTDWGIDQFGDDVILPNETLEVGDYENGLYDLMAVAADDTVYSTFAEEFDGDDLIIEVEDRASLVEKVNASLRVTERKEEKLYTIVTNYGVEELEVGLIKMDGTALSTISLKQRAHMIIDSNGISKVRLQEKNQEAVEFSIQALQNNTFTYYSPLKVDENDPNFTLAEPSLHVVKYMVKK